jgi:penicillin amidase
VTWSLDEQVAKLPEADRRRLEAYCAGINASLAARPLPPELRLLKHAPEPWTPRDVLAIGLFQGWSLSWDAGQEAVRDRLRAAVEDDAVFDMLVATSRSLGGGILDADPADWPEIDAAAPPPAPDMTPATPAPALADHRPARRDALAAVFDPHPGEGSNGWAIHGSKTADGKPILAGDPHLSLPWPPVFYEAHIRTTDGVDVSGATFPGMPMVVIGRAAGVAWTLTTSYTDVEDLVRLDTIEGDESHYRVAGLKQPYTIKVQEFRAKGRLLHAEGYRGTVWGPVFGPGRERDLLPGATYAWSWTGLEPDPIPLATAFEALYRATEPEQVAAAASALPIPCQNWVYATANGHIGWVLGGRLVNPEVSLLPRDGTAADPFADRRDAVIERPQVVDPAAGYVVGTNQPLTRDGPRTGSYFSGPHRALRVHQVVSGKDGWTTDDTRALQMDTTNLEAVRMVPLLLAAADAAPPTDPTEQAMVEALRSWDRRMQADQAGPLVYEAWRGQLHRQLGALHIGDVRLRMDWLKKRLSEAAMEVALFEDGGERFWDDPETPETETSADAIRAALSAAARETRGELGADVDGWTWGALHVLDRAHPLAGVPLIGRKYRQPAVAADGGRHVLWALDHYGVIGDYATADGPALRQVVVPGDRAGFVLPGGNVGRPGDRFASDQVDDWLVGRQHVAGQLPEAPVSHVQLVPTTN